MFIEDCIDLLKMNTYIFIATEYFKFNRGKPIQGSI